MNFHQSMAMVLAAAWLATAAFAADLPCPAEGSPPPATSEADLAAKWGIQVASLRMTAGDRLVDFRYKVLDPDKAAVLGQRESKAYLIDQATQTKLRVPSSPKVGALRARADKPTAGTIYTVLFGNAAKVVHSGSRVTIEIGEFRAADLKVE